MMAAKTDSSLTREWYRLNEIAEKHEPSIRYAFTRAVALGPSTVYFSRTPIMAIVAETCRTTAEEHGLSYSPSHPVILKTVDDLLENFAQSVNDKKAIRAVAAILPWDLSMAEREARSNLAYGLDERTAISLERKRQEIAGNKRALEALDRERKAAIQSRSNLIAVTETNRAVNASVEAVWSIQEGISKALIPTQDNQTVYGREITNPAKPGRRARKMILTRRDERVCNYCDPLDGITARLGQSFDTEYGYFDYPPFHPRCRCFIYVTTEI